MVYDSLIIGAGPCGIGAALKLKEAGLNFLIFEKGVPGGKVNIAPRVDNYPRQHEIPGPDLAMIFYNRLNEAGISLTCEEVLSLEKADDLFKLTTSEGEYLSKTVLIATGTKERKIGLAKEDELLGHGISYCAVCDGHFFKNATIAVIGGGNSALKEAIYLSHLGKKVYVIHRRNAFRGSDKVLNELKEQPNIEILTPYVPMEILGEDKLTGLVIKNVETEELKTLSLDGLFPLVGQIPQTQFINIEGVKDEWGTIPCDKNMETSCQNLFAGGDVLPRELRQIYLSEHDGMVAAANIINRIK